MNTQQLIEKAKQGYMKVLFDGREHLINAANVETPEGKVICEVEAVNSRSSFREWGRVAFYIVKDGKRYRSRFSKAKALELLG